MVLGLGIMNFAGIPLLGGNPLPVTVQDWIEAHPGSVICGEVEQYENTEFSQSVYLKKTYLIYQSKKFSIENVRVFLKKEEDLKPGMKILVKGTLKRVEEPANPGGFDSQHYYACRHIYYFMKNAVVRKKTESYSGYRQLLLHVKEKCRQILTAAAGEDAPLFCAMVLGDKQDLDPEMRMRYQLAGIVHILAISGLHISILGMGLYNLLKKIGLGIWPAGIFSLGVMLQYGIMTGGSISTMRAVTMFLIAMGARITGRIYDMMTALSVTAMMILLESPAYLLDSGFLLSFGCVLGIGVAAEKICALAGAEKKWTKALVSSMALQLVTLPVMLKFFGEVSLAGFFLNLLVLPSVGFVLTGGMAALLLGIFCIPAAKLVILPARGLLLFYEYLCSLAGKLRWSTWIGGEPEIWQILVYYGILITVLFIGQYVKIQIRKEKESSQRKERSGEQEKAVRWKLCTLRMAAGALLTAGILVLGFHPSGKLKVTCLDVGQGDGILVETPDNHHFLIDGGSSSQSDLGRYCLLPALKSQGISYLDGLFISHTDKDHISGAKELLEYMGNGLTTIRAGYLVLPSWKEKPEAWEELSDAAKKAGIKVVTGKKGDELHCGKVSFSILWPEKNATGKDVNEDAMVMELSFGEFQMLFTGDIGADTEKKLLASGTLEDVDCLKVGHHGSRYSTTEAFLEKIKPELAIISCSSTNTYGHPSPETVERLEAAGSQVEYTMKNGAITVETDGKKLKIYRFRRD
jgi:competence protein ComEC